MGIEDYGLYVILWSFVLLLGSVQIPFIINPLLTLGAKTININNKYFLSSYIYFQLFFSGFSLLFLTLIYFISMLFGIVYQSEVFLGLILYGISYNSYEFYRRYLFTISKERTVLYTDVVTHLFILVFILLIRNLNLFELKTFLYLSFCVYFFGTLFCSKKTEFCKIKVNFLYVRFKINFRYALPMLKQSVAQFFSGHIFVYLSAILLGRSMAGVIGVLRNIFAPLIVGMMALDNMMPNRAMRIYEEQSAHLIGYVNKVFREWATLFIIFSISVLFFGEFLVSLLYGDEYITYVDYLPWFAVTHFVMLIIRVLSIYARTLDIMKTFATQGFTSLGFTLILSYPLIYFYELNGAFFIMFTQQLIMLFFLVKDTKYFISYVS